MALRTADLAESCSSSRLQLILMPTEACNFRCVYCYESFQYKRMEPWVVSGVKNLLEHRAGELEHLLLTWFGGEPLLAQDVIRDVMSHTRRLEAEYPRLRVDSDITTNAWRLTRDVAQELLALRVTKFQISFDGPRESHDRKRIRPGGIGTFDRIWANLCGMRDIPDPFEIKVRLHVDRDNYRVLPEFIQEFGREFGRDNRFELFIRTLGRFGGPNDEHLPVFNREEGKVVVDELRDLATSHGIRTTPAVPGTNICYAAKANSFLIRANGDVNKCTLALDHPANRVGTIEEDGALRLESERMFFWMRGLSTWDEEALACPMKELRSR